MLEPRPSGILGRLPRTRLPAGGGGRRRPRHPRRLLGRRLRTPGLGHGAVAARRRCRGVLRAVRLPAVPALDRAAPRRAAAAVDDALPVEAGPAPGPRLRRHGRRRHDPAAGQPRGRGRPVGHDAAAGQHLRRRPPARRSDADVEPVHRGRLLPGAPGPDVARALPRPGPPWRPPRPARPRHGGDERRLADGPLRAVGRRRDDDPALAAVLPRVVRRRHPPGVVRRALPRGPRRRHRSRHGCRARSWAARPACAGWLREHSSSSPRPRWRDRPTSRRPRSAPH